MKYYSTRNAEKKYTAAQAIAKGLADDGGLFVPETIPLISMDEIKSFCGMDYRGRALAIMLKYLDEFSKEELEGYVNSAYGDNYDDDRIAPLHFTNDATAYLELWHGPTCAFKDMALQMLPHLLTASLKKTGEEKKVCILVATSGDTGKAALEGFKDVQGTRIFVFYPKDGVSDIQRLQMVTQEGGNVGVCSVTGNFDDAQTGVKKIFSDLQFAKELEGRGFFLSSANSINWGRLLPQVVYYFSAYCDYVNSRKLELGEELVFCVPTGNFGNILAGWYAKQMGLPIGKFVCASNENNVLTDFFATGVYNKNRPFHTTISPSMDILVSSNLERMLHAYCGDATVAELMGKLNSEGIYEVPSDTLGKISRDFTGGVCSDEQTKIEIKAVLNKSSYLIDTHTAVASKVLSDYREETGDNRPAVVVSTASPYKFAGDVVSALGGNEKADALTELNRLSGTKTPKPLLGLGKRQVRFSENVESGDMKQAVDKFLR